MSSDSFFPLYLLAGRRHLRFLALRRTYSTKLVKSGKPDKQLDEKKPVPVERRIINHKGQLTHTEVDVKSQALCDILIEINKDVECLSLKKEPPFVRVPTLQLKSIVLIPSFYSQGRSFTFHSFKIRTKGKAVPRREKRKPRILINCRRDRSTPVSGGGAREQYGKFGKHVPRQ